jgi:hypothetical protein
MIEIAFLFVLFVVAANLAVLPTVLTLWRHLSG